MKKIIHPCDVDLKYRDDRTSFFPVFCKIEYTDGRLSITGVVAPTRGGNCRGSCGQIDGTLRELRPSDRRLGPGWDRAKFAKFLDIWDRWHLNDLKAGCEHQRAMGWDTERIDPTRDTGWHVDRHANLKRWVREEEGGYLGKPCPVCGYKYGTAWLREEVPADVIDWLGNLPDTDRTPAWV